MNKKDYFAGIVALFEATGMAGTPEVIPQEQIADSGSDVMPQNQMAEEDPNMMQDPNVMDPSLMGGQMMAQPSQENSPEDVSAIMKKQKLIKLFDLYEDLYNYGKVFLESIKVIDINLLDEDRFKKLKLYVDNVDRVVEMIGNYLENIFSHKEYGDVLYDYITYRTQLVTAIGGVRDVLKLNNPDEKLDK